MGSPIEGGQVGTDLVGTWRLDSAFFVAQTTGDRVDILGANPFGFFILEPNGRMITLMTSDTSARDAAASDRAGLFASMISYTGRVSVDGDTIVIHVDGAWDPSWVGTQQVRRFSLDGQQLTLLSAPLHHPSFPDDELVAHVVWGREA